MTTKQLTTCQRCGKRFHATGMRGTYCSQGCAKAGQSRAAVRQYELPRGGAK